ncbi:unnamed protein product [Bursaphelenchus xylophilus]|uniref:(pine wood nematode) hypothetical protein n=1 Tax=Bursaphelenchus xylophilus TaxID=6326 RepID=A0A1I7RT48_BURXY|nr:unnamed protein product [Bursaphelenchus xylophilus]CAG9122614.1 unnamed protein product [Bursaphelenchus xylophilus]
MIESVHTTAKLNANADFNLNSDERKVVNELKKYLGQKVIDESPLFNDDMSLLRWCLAFDNKYDLIVEKYQDTSKTLASMKLYDVEFNDVDDINEFFKSYHATAEYYAGGLVGQDKDGDWILCQVIGRVKPKQFAYCGRVSDLFKGTLMSNIILYNLVRQTERKQSRRCGMKLIYDLNGLGKEHFYPPTVKVYLNVLKLAQDHFPELMHRVFIINAPGMFASAYNVFKSVLTTRLRKLVEIMNGDYKARVFDQLGQENVYPNWGGTKIPKRGLPGCGTLLMAGPIPEHFRYSPEKNPLHVNDKQLKKISVPPRQEKEVRILGQKGHKLVWFLKSSSEIDFSVWLGEKILRPKFRIQTDFVPEFDEVEIDEDGEIVLVFDNKFSTFSKKSIYYYVDVKPKD